MKPYETLHATQRRVRRREALGEIQPILDRIGVPLRALTPANTASPNDLIHLSTSTREQIRSVPSLRIPSEQSIIKCKKSLAATHATETATFVGGAYITDPLAYVSLLCVQSPFIVVGGDCGGGLTKLGITYASEGVQKFACLLVYEGGDSWLELQDCRAEGLTKFKGESAPFPHVWAVLQQFIDTRGALLNGDWKFINAVLGLMSPSSNHPCPICILHKSQLHKTARYRTANDTYCVDPSHSPLLRILPERIVPTPLHLFLGISNRIILDAFKEMFGEEAVLNAVQYIKSIHSAGCGGLSDLYDLNGPEISKFIKKECSTILLAAADATSSLPASTRASHSMLSRWLKQLHHCLLRTDDWSVTDLFIWRGVVEDIHQHWREETGQNAFPKLHMLRHTIDFAERHRFLGRVSEAQIESFHATFNSLFHKHHHNQSRNTEERIRRSLADASLRAVQPCLVQ